MEFENRTSFDNQKLEEMYENLTNISKQLALLQGFMESKFGSEFTTFCQLSEQSSSSSSSSSSANQTYASAHNSSMQDDSEEYDKMPNLVSQESPSRTLGYVTVPLRQTSSTSLSGTSSKLQNLQNAGITRRDRNSVVKEEIANDNEDMMYPLHNFSDLLVESAGEVDANETPEFLELELDPSTLLRGEPPALQPMFADNNGSNDLQVVGNNHNGATTGHSKRSSSRQSGSNSNSFHRYDMEMNNSSRGNHVSRRASIGNHDSGLSHKKFDCLICGIKFEFAETLKSHMDSHGGSRNIRCQSNSEDQTSLGNNPSAPPLPKLMPRPSITSVSDIKVSAEISDSVTLKPARTKKSSSHSHGTSSASTSASSKTSSAIKRRRHYNQSRPCSLVCPECGLKIRDKSRLIEHLRGHTGERPFQCSYCDKSYTRKDVLKTHMVKMHGDAPSV